MSGHLPALRYNVLLIVPVDLPVIFIKPLAAPQIILVCRSQLHKIINCPYHIPDFISGAGSYAHLYDNQVLCGLIGNFVKGSHRYKNAVVAAILLCFSVHGNGGCSAYNRPVLISFLMLMHGKSAARKNRNLSDHISLAAV